MTTSSAALRVRSKLRHQRGFDFLLKRSCSTPALGTAY